MEFFVYNNSTNSLEIDEHSILLVKEFADLWDKERNKCRADRTGKKRILAYKELTYIYLMLDYKSPYFTYTEKQKHDAAFADSGLTNKNLQDPAFKKAYNKYLEIQESDPILSLIKTAYRTLFKMQVFLDNLDFNTDVDELGRPLFKPKDVIADISSIAKMRTQLQELEVEHKKNLAASGSKVRGDIDVGYDEQ